MDEQWMPENKEELMTAIEREWNLLLQLAESLTDEQMLRPDAGGWSPKDNLAHLFEWMKILAGTHLEKRPAHEVIGVTEDVIEGWDMEKINPVLFERNQSRSRKEVMDELKRVYDATYEKLVSMSFEELLAPRRSDDPEKRPLLLWVLGDTADHFLEHRETIERGLKAGAS